MKANGLPTPVFNFIKRCVLFAVASITTENIKMQASPMGNAANGKDAQRISDVVNRDFDQLFEYNKISSIIREYMRNAAVDGDGCTYPYWDAELDTGRDTKGGIVTEISRTRVSGSETKLSGRSKQPYILIESPELTEELRARAEKMRMRQLAGTSNRILKTTRSTATSRRTTRRPWFSVCGKTAKPVRFGLAR